MKLTVILAGICLAVGVLIGALGYRFLVKPITPAQIVTNTLDQAQAQLQAAWAKTLLTETKPIVLEKVVVKTWYGGTKEVVKEIPVETVITKIIEKDPDCKKCFDQLGPIACPPPSVKRVLKGAWDFGVGPNIDSVGIVRGQVNGAIIPYRINLFGGKVQWDVVKVGGDAYYNPGASQISGDIFIRSEFHGSGK